MLWTVVVVLMILGVISVVGAYKLGAFVCPMLVVERVVGFLDHITGHKLHLDEHIFEDERAR